MTLHFSRNGEKLRLPILYFTFLLLRCHLLFGHLLMREKTSGEKSNLRYDAGFRTFFCLIFALHSKTTMKMWDLRIFQEIHG